MKTENRITISAMPWAAGLINQGGQATVPERSLWEAKNADMDSTGRLFKRRSFRAWGQPLESPTPDGLQYTELMQSMDNFSYTASGSDVTSELDGNGLRFETRATSGSSAYYLRVAQDNDGTADSATTATVTLFLKPGKMQIQSATTTADHGPSIHIRSSHANICTLLFLKEASTGDTAVYYFNGTNFVTSGVTMKSGRWHKLSVRITAATTVRIVANPGMGDEDSATVTFVSYTDIAVGTNQVAFSAETNSQGVYDIAFNFLQYRTNTISNAFTFADLKLIKGWASSMPETRHLLAVSRDVLYNDADHLGFFRALDRAPSGEPLMVPWLSELIICGSSDYTRRWDGNGRPEPCPAATPQRVIAAAAHQGRLWAVSSDEPMTLRFSGANDLSLWHTEDAAGNIEPTGFDIPDPRGGRITAMRGDFYGLLIVWTENSTWIVRTAGNPQDDGVLQMVSANVGCIGPDAHDAVGRDVLFLGRDGVHSLSTVQEFGDVASVSLTAGLRGLWQHDNNIDQPKVIPNRRSALVHAPALAKTFISVQRGGFDNIQNIYVLNHDTKQWVGPWEPGSVILAANGGGYLSIDMVDFGVPSATFLFAADTQGGVSYLGSDKKADYQIDLGSGGQPYQFFLRSARLDGRSVSPELVKRVKVWRQLRLYVLPRDSSNVKVTWNVDGKDASDDATRSLNIYKEPLLSSTFNLGESALGDPERMGVLYFTLDTRGRWLEFRVEIEDDTSTGDRDIVVVGFEVDALVGGEEKES